ncbi:two pore calcium channel protein 1-like isoform X2 [Apostichopus japonicus]|uniref:two pore calcium channel protein 1-like isoform X2 n=1 Tax=Stichopus japonicus TaxID=307972 RepID=UPI003AB561BA
MALVRSIVRANQGHEQQQHGLIEEEEDDDITGEIPTIAFPSSSTSIGSINHFPDDKRWELNYQEAAIYLQEGENNNRFDTHPSNQSALPAYLIVHNTYFFLIDLAASILLMSLALIESPAVPVIEVDEFIHASLELFCLTLIAIGVGMKMRWLGLKSFLKHKRTAIKAVVLLIMYVEAIIVIIRHQSHFRVTRALRPFFFIDCHYSRGVRRSLRQIFQSLPPIVEMLVLLFYFLLIFATLGFYLFSKIDHNDYFRTMGASFVNLFVLQTTANYPDVMMPAYNSSRWSALFFIVFLILELYFLTNVLLAVVYNTFTDVEKEKFKRLYLHKRLGASMAFRRLCSRMHPGLISFPHFLGLMKYYKSNHSKRDVLLAFRTLNSSGTGFINLSEFFNIYEVSLLKWTAKQDEKLWFESLFPPLDKPFRLINYLVNLKPFEILVYAVIALNGSVFIISTIVISGTGSAQEVMETLEVVHWYDIAFVTFYGIECLLKILGLGCQRYFGNTWNVFDFIVTVVAISGIIFQVVDTNFYFVVILRPLRLLRLFKVRKRYRDVAATVRVLMPRMFSMGLVIVVMYYFYAIVGMELFSEAKLENCCQNTTLEEFYSNSSSYHLYFYLNNFEHILNAYVTLFELTVGNNWHVIMNAIAMTVSEWSILYFIIFYLSSMVVVTVTVAYVLEAFLFRMQFAQSDAARIIEADTAIEVNVNLYYGDMQSMFKETASDLQLTILKNDLRLSQTQSLRFKGARPRTKADLSKTMYAREVEEWIRDSDLQERKELRRFLVREMSRQSLTTVCAVTPPARDSPLLTRVPFQDNTGGYPNHIPELNEQSPNLRNIQQINNEQEDERTESMEDGGISEDATRFEVEAEVEARSENSSEDVETGINNDVVSENRKEDNNESEPIENGPDEYNMERRTVLNGDHNKEDDADVPPTVL